MQQKTTAKVKHRDYVPYGWLAIPFCHIEFYGFHAEEMESKWKKITGKRYDTYNEIYEKNKAKIKKMYDEVNAIHEQIKESKPFYRFWYNKEEKELLAKRQKLLLQAYELEEENEEIKKKRFFSAREYHRVIEQFLQKKGFVLMSATSTGEECKEETEIWILEE